MEPRPVSALKEQQRILPTSDAQRIISLDILRGFAVLGILVMNIQSFSMVGAAYMNPTAYGSLEGANLWVWILSHVLAALKFMAIFSMLFGAGIVLMWSRAQESGRPRAGLHFRRMFWLILIGLMHAYLLWYGDILFFYGICGMLVYWFRKAQPTTLLVIGLVLLCFGSTIYILGGLSMPHWPPQELEEFEQGLWDPPPDKIAAELEAYQGNWIRQMDERVDSVVMMHTEAFPFFMIWRITGLMLIGMALFKLGVFSGVRSPRFYAGLVCVAAVVGLPIVVYGVVENFEQGWSSASFFLGSQYNYWGSLLISLGWVGIVMLVYKGGWLSQLTVRLAAVGKMALSCYLLETIICTTLFYGHG
ncbi:MAG TPA: DUF418 domain-containing protein, partial [Acidobacteriota bacterium]|nr:DUF418 domain-containing protein [Acidobacteriota bacterium]